MTYSNERSQKIFKAMENCNLELEIAGEYGEPGYSKDEGQQDILLSNWNDLDKYPNIMEYLEENYAIEWNDEWVIDYDGGCVCYRCSPDSYSWRPSFIHNHTGEVLPAEFINEMDSEDFKEFLENNEYLNNPKKAINIEGFEPRGICMNEDHHHLFVHTPDPVKIYEKVKNEHPDKDFYFVVDNVEQFGLEFSLYMID